MLKTKGLDGYLQSFKSRNFESTNQFGFQLMNVEFSRVDHQVTVTLHRLQKSTL